MKKILQLAFTDFKLIFRDPSLKSFLALPLILFALVIWGIPPLVEKYDFLIPYLPVFLVVAVIENTQVFSFISSMVLIDEKETDVAKVYGIVPLNKTGYLFSRFLIPYLFTVLLNVVLFAVQPFFAISWGANILISLLAALVVPVYVLSVNALVENRMQGMVYIKAFNLLVLLPITAFFVPEATRSLFGVLPTHWIFQSINNATQGASFTLTWVIGFVFLITLLIWIAKVFIKRHFV